MLPRPPSFRRRHVTAWLTILLALSTAGCGSATANGGFSGDAPDEGSANEIVSSEIREIETSYQTARDVIQHLRPRWLRSRSPRSFGGGSALEPVVYLDRARIGNLSSLYRISSAAIERMVYVEGIDASTRYGGDHAAGAIEVFTR